MGDVPQLATFNTLTPAPQANVQADTLVNGNTLGGSFRLTFQQQTSAAIPHNAAAYEMQQALEAMSAIGGVDVTRSAPDHQGGYQWTVTFTSDVNAGHVDTLVSDYSALTGKWEEGFFDKL